MDHREDQTAPVSEQDVKEANKLDSNELRSQIVNKILGALNERRDAYYGIVSSIIYIIDSQDVGFINCMRDGLISLITSHPMRYGGKMFISKAVARLISEQPLFIIDLFELIIQTTLDWSGKFIHLYEVLKIQIVSLKMIRQAEQSRGSRATNISQDRIDQLCADALFNCDDSTKIDTLSLVLEDRSTCKPLEDKELKLFKVLFQDALSLQEPALRQIFISLTNKFLRRIKDSHRVVQRDKKAFSEEQRSAINTRYIDFLSWLIEFCFDSIYCNAYFGSFILTISTLKLVIEHITFCDKELPVEPLFSSRRCYDSILSCLNDSFEENKALALELLFSLPYNHNFYSEENLMCFEKIAYHLVGSVNPAHSLTCQYIFKLLIGLSSKKEDSTLSKNQLLLKHLGILTDMIEEGLKETREDFVVALKQKPIYPKLSCIRALLDEIDINTMENDRERWEQLARRIVQGSMDACKAVSTIVCNLNPETIGHLPMDLKPVDADTLSKTLKVSLKISDSKLNTITSQMLLISGWKTIKECSLSLGAMCIRFWWPRERIKMKKEKFPGLKTEPILNSDDVSKIIDFFDHYLRNLRHRGAFEQAYNGFMMVTRRVWHDEQFRKILIETLNHIMNDFRKVASDEKRAECLKAYVTRRSAGLPFIVQAILNSEHKHDSIILRWVMDCLFEVLESSNAEEYQQIHCLNILRALIKEHFLGEKVLSYVGKTFAITMDSFRSDSFPIRNCANMLLKAIVDRTFGVNRLRSDIHRRNQLSFERFFTECPGLHAKMLQNLEDGLIERKYLAAVHSVFIVLFRLRPSLNPSPDFSADKIIKPFIKPIVELAYCCPDYKLRELAAKLAVRLEVFCTNTNNRSIYLNNINEYITITTTSMQSELPRDFIRVHGALALAKNWVEVNQLDCNTVDVDRCKLFLFAQELVCKICKSNYPGHDYPRSIKTVALELAESCCINGDKHNDDKHWLLELDSLIKLWQSYLNERDKREPNVETLVFKSVNVLLMGTQMSPSSSSSFMKEMTDKTKDRIHDIVDLMVRIIKQEPNRTFSVNLQASLVRFLRQLFNESDDYVDELLEELDMDPTANQMTPYDQLRLRHEFDTERDKLFRYCEQFGLREYLRQQASSLLLDRELFNFSQYKEFRPNQGGKFTAKVSNSPRSVELVAFACKNWHHFKLDTNSVWIQDPYSDSLGNKLKFLTQFISNLPDCDIKCLALLCAGKMMASQIKQLFTPDNDNDESLVKGMELFSKLLDELADGDHSLTIRKTCAQVLQSTLKRAIEKNSGSQFQGCLMNLLSALIKLSQDEENEVRSSGQRVMLSLRAIEIAQAATGQPQEEPVARLTDGIAGGGGSRLDHLIRLITSKLFDPNNEMEINNCFELLMRIVFNHAKNYSNDVNEEKERLFDKTKLNTFADHVATIRSSLDGLQTFFDCKSSSHGLIELNSLRIPRDIRLELRVVDRQFNDNTGDYSWRLKKVMEGLPETSCATNSAVDDDDDVTNEQIVDEFLENLIKSLNYFSNGYWNVLVDTEYTYHEMSLYKRIGFIKFVVQCTKHQLKNKHLLIDIQNTIQKIVDECCCTTLLYKCRNFLNDDSQADLPA